MTDSRDILAAARDHVVVYDGGMGATLEPMELSAEDYGGLQGKCHEALILNRPDVIADVHNSMLEAGAEVLETDSFQGSRLKLEEWGLGEHTEEINRRAAEIAREAAGPERFVAGSIGPTGFLPASDDPTLGDISFKRLVEVFDEQAGALVSGGADLLIIETAQDILEVRAAIIGARESFKRVDRAVPIQVSVSLLPNGGKMLLGTDIEAVLAIAEGMRVDILGLNCSTGPEDMRDAIRYLGEHAPMPVHCIPNAGLPLQGADGETIFPEGPEQLSKALGEFVERHGVSIVGGCCGTTPEHIAAIAERVKGIKPGERPAPGPPRMASMMTAVDLVQEPAPTLVGERVNSQGSRKAKELLLGRRLRRPARGRRGPGQRRRPRARSLRRADRARRRGRADVEGRRARLADPAAAAADRLDRARGDRGRARADPRAGRSSTRSTSRPAARSSTASCRWRSATAPR